MRTRVSPVWKNRASLARRLRLTIFSVGIINVVLVLLAVDLAYDDMYQGILQIELEQERALLQQRIAMDVEHDSWNTPHLTTDFVPEDEAAASLPEVFVGLSVPYSGELSHNDERFLVSIEQLEKPRGVLYVAQEISLLREREHRFQIALLAIALLMLGLTFLLAHYGANHLVRPLRRLSHQIRHIVPGSFMPRLSIHYRESEYVDISATFNRFLDALEAHVQREKSMLAMAGHELRTPLTVISGALDVLEQRGTLSPDDLRTASRIRRATNDMRADVEVLLNLTRGERASDEQSSLSLRQLLLHVVEEIELSKPDQAERIRLSGESTDRWVEANPAMVRMLFRNLLQNAVKHTHNPIDIVIYDQVIHVRDTGPGLPEDVRQQLEEGRLDSRPEAPLMARGLGLFIVQLVCERLGWPLRVLDCPDLGTVIEIRFQDDEAPE